MHTRHLYGALEGNLTNQAECWNPMCKRTFSYIHDEHLFCTKECFDSYKRATAINWSDVVALNAHFVGVRV